MYIFDRLTLRYTSLRYHNHTYTHTHDTKAYISFSNKKAIFLFFAITKKAHIYIYKKTALLHVVKFSCMEKEKEVVEDKGFYERRTRQPQVCRQQQQQEL